MNATAFTALNTLSIIKPPFVDIPGPAKLACPTPNLLPNAGIPSLPIAPLNKSGLSLPTNQTIQAISVQLLPSKRVD